MSAVLCNSLQLALSVLFSESTNSVTVELHGCRQDGVFEPTFSRHVNLGTKNFLSKDPHILAISIDGPSKFSTVAAHLNSVGRSKSCEIILYGISGHLKGFSSYVKEPCCLDF